MLSVGASCAAGYLLWQKLWRRKPKPWPDHDLEVPFSELHRLHEVIEREGVAIVTGVIDAGELREMEQDFVRDLSDIIDEDATYRIGFGELKQWLMNDGPKSA